MLKEDEKIFSLYLKESSFLKTNRKKIKTKNIGNSKVVKYL